MSSLFQNLILWEIALRQWHKIFVPVLLCHILQPHKFRDLINYEFVKVWSVSYIGGTRVLVPGHQNSGAPPFFFRVFLMVFSHLCWQCSNKNRKCREHINTLGKKDKLIFLKPIFEIKTKNLLSTWKGTRVLVPGHQNSGALSSWQ